MAVIKDIRVYRSTHENIDGTPLPETFINKQGNIVLHRIVMKLREKGFVLGDFDHLYINLSTYPVEEQISPSKRSKDRYHPWYRYYDVEISKDLFTELETPYGIDLVIEYVKAVLLKYFSDSQFGADQICACISEAVTQGEKMLMVFKSKISSKGKAIIYLRYLDSGKYYPLLRVYDLDDHLLFEKDLPETLALDEYGEIQLSNTKVIIKPRKNAFTNDLHPISFVFRE